MMSFSDIRAAGFLFFLQNKKKHLAACNQSIYSPHEAGASVHRSQGLF